MPRTRTVENSGKASNSQTLNTPTIDTAEATIALQQAEIKQLTALLQAAEARTTEDPCSQSPDRFAQLLEALSQRLTGDIAPAKKSTKLLDPPVFTNSKDPTFDNWKIKINGKLTVNANYFADEQACMTYVFGRTGRDAQKHLNP
jgi:hypothetical protein